MASHYPVVVIGSGYGGAIAAARLARAGQHVCVLERGREILPGEYPERFEEALCEMQTDSPRGRLGSRTGLYYFQVNGDLSVLSGCGLGGTSLINAGVALRAHPRVFQDGRWPREMGADDLDRYYRRAEAMFQPAPYPQSHPPLAKLRLLEKAANALGGSFYRVPVNVAFTRQVNAAGIEQPACNLCGDCVSGCNTGAKSTLLMNYLPDAKSHGAELFTRIAVRHLERGERRWRIYWQWLDSGRERFNDPLMMVTADCVILAAGSLGSTEILLRSKERGLPLSDRVGEKLTANGDVVGFAYNTPYRVNGIGAGTHSIEEIGPVGPCITGIIDLRGAPREQQAMVIEEGVVPGAIAGLLPGVLAGASKLGSLKAKTRGSQFATRSSGYRLGRALESLFAGPYRGATRNTLTFLVMAEDDGKGKMFLRDDRLRIEWPGLNRQPVFDEIASQLTGASAALGGEFIRKLPAEHTLSSEILTVHPLGGCVMSDDAENGVVNHRGQVFSGDRGDAVYGSLYVMDGSTVPSPLGVNPLLTISALAERAADLLAESRSWENRDVSPQARRGRVRVSLPQPALPHAVAAPSLGQACDNCLSEGEGCRGPRRLGLRFIERMKGYFRVTSIKADAPAQLSSDLTRAHATAAGPVHPGRSSLEFTLTIATDDVEEVLQSSAHRFHMAGTVLAPALSARPLHVANGEFEMLSADPERASVRRMIYRAKMASEDGREFYLEGLKIVRSGSFARLWPETTTLHISVFSGPSGDGPALGHGVLRISPQDFLRQLTTIEVTGARDRAERLAVTARFGRFFGGILWETYGGVVACPRYFNASAPARKKRPLRAPAPEVHFFSTQDGVELRFLRYCGGKKGPVILSHGVGVSSLIFRIDTIQTNLVEYLTACGFDVWALDYRASTEVPASRFPSTADDVARYDYPAAVAKVCKVTGAESVQVVAHCYGSISFCMAMLRGLPRVRAAVCSQVALHPIGPSLTRLKCGLYIPDVLHKLGVKSLSAYVDAHADWAARLYDTMLKLYPVPAAQRCSSAVCHRITFMYSEAYEHARLNEATHGALHELFGMTNMKAFEHLARLVRAQRLVTAKGRDAYMPNLDRLRIPITFIHGAQNRCFVPESTHQSWLLLRSANGAEGYDRVVLPRYGHSDSIFGKDAAIDVYPHIARALEKHG